jgi:hypothetical protein
MDFKIFNEYKYKIIKPKDKQIALANLNSALSLSKNNIEQQLLNSLVCDNTYCPEMDLDKFKIYLDIFESMKYKDDAEKIMHDLMDKGNLPQINTIKRIIEKKPIRNNTQKDEPNLMEIKLCPHCKNKNIGYSNTTYAICGYSEKGFDWKGCGKDWCFKCGKKLCKSWNLDLLFNKLNRFHNNKCCKAYASSHGDLYPDNYCQCSTTHVHRNKIQNPCKKF